MNLNVDDRQSRTPSSSLQTSTASHTEREGGRERERNTHPSKRKQQRSHARSVPQTPNQTNVHRIIHSIAHVTLITSLVCIELVRTATYFVNPFLGGLVGIASSFLCCSLFPYLSVLSPHSYTRSVSILTASAWACS